MQILYQVLLAASILLQPNTGALDEVQIKEIKQQMPFKLLIPQSIPKNWGLEVKNFPMEKNEGFEYVALHYFDDKKNFMLSVLEANSTHKKNVSHVQGEKTVDINGNIAYFSNWKNTKPELPGGVLWWVQGNTYINCTSQTLTEDELVKIARSMK